MPAGVDAETQPRPFQGGRPGSREDDRAGTDDGPRERADDGTLGTHRDAAHGQVELPRAQVRDEVGPAKADDLETPARFTSVEASHGEVEAVVPAISRGRERWVVARRPDAQHGRTGVASDAPRRREDDCRERPGPAEAGYARPVTGSRCRCRYRR